MSRRGQPGQRCKLIHNAEGPLEKRPYACAECGHTSRSQWNLLEHRERHRPYKELACTVCGKTFRLHRRATSHMKRKHNKNRSFCVIVGCGVSHANATGMKQHFMEERNYNTRKLQFGGDRITPALQTAILKGPEGPGGPEGPHLPGLRRPTRMIQIEAPRPPAPGVSGTSTLTPTKMVGFVVTQVTGHTGVGPEGAAPLDHSKGGKKNTHGSEEEEELQIKTEGAVTIHLESEEKNQATSHAETGPLDLSSGKRNVPKSEREEGIQTKIEDVSTLNIGSEEEDPCPKETCTRARAAETQVEEQTRVASKFQYISREGPGRWATHGKGVQSLATNGQDRPQTGRTSHSGPPPPPT